jgi:hypothetical protein
MDEKHAQSPRTLSLGSFCFGVKAHLSNLYQAVFWKKKGFVMLPKW